MFYLIQWTWGIVENIIGVIFYLIFIKQTHAKVGRTIATFLPFNLGNFSLGMFIFLERRSNLDVISHEVGHCYQNCIYGVFKLFIVSVPSFIRYWFCGAKNLSFEEYNKVWFEAQATELGKKYFK